MKLNNQIQLRQPRLRSEQNRTVTSTSAHCTYIPLQLTAHYTNFTLQLTNHYSNSPLQLTAHCTNNPLQLTAHCTNSPLQLTAHCTNNPLQLTAHYTNNPLQLTAHCTINQLALTAYYTNIPFQLTTHCINTQLELKAHDTDIPLQLTSHCTIVDRPYFGSLKCQRTPRNFILRQDIKLRTELSIGMDGVLTGYLIHSVERIMAPQATACVLVGELVFLICPVLQNSANLVPLSPLYRSSPKEIPICEAIVPSSLPPVCNAGRHGVNSITVCSAECTRGTKCKGLWVWHFLFCVRTVNCGLRRSEFNDT